MRWTAVAGVLLGGCAIFSTARPASTPVVWAPFRLAHVELIEWLEADYGFGRWDAYMLTGQLAESTVANIVDPIYTVVAKFPKEYLPK